MAYLGNDLSTIVKSGKIAYKFLATSGQTSFSGNDANGVSLELTADSFVNVFLNGVRLIKTDDYTLSTNTLTLVTGATLNDELVIVRDIDNSVYTSYTRTETDTVVNTAINNLKGSVGTALDTLDELAAALADDANFASTVTTALAAKANQATTYTKTEVDNALATKAKFTSSSSAPSSPTAGDLWYDTVNKAMFHYTDVAWLQMSNKFSATGGTITTSGAYKYHTFTSSGTFTAEATGTIEYLIVAGGGGGGASSGNGCAAGGGAGGYRSGSASLNAGSYSITIGAGGNGASALSTTQTAPSGSNSSFNSIVSIGGGGGGSGDNGQGASGGSGGGSQGGSVSGGAATSGQGNNGGTGGAAGDQYTGGGGGAGSAGTNGNLNSGGGNGGAGLNWQSLGTYYAGGGGGGTQTGYNAGAGGIGGGGNGSASGAGGAGSTNTGGGGGGNGKSGNPGGNGGSGIVIIRYPL